MPAAFLSYIIPTEADGQKVLLLLREKTASLAVKGKPYEKLQNVPCDKFCFDSYNYLFCFVFLRVAPPDEYPIPFLPKALAHNAYTVSVFLKTCA